MRKQYYKCLLALTCLLLVAGCKEKKTTDANLTAKTTTMVCKDGNFGKVRDRLVDSLSFIPLEETTNAYLSTIAKVIVTEGRIFVFDKIGGNTLVSFDMDGRHAVHYGNRGNGNKEYIMLSDFSVNSGHVYLYDYRRKRMLVYDLTGEFVGSRETDFRGKGFISLENGNFLFALEKDKNLQQLCLTDSTLRIKKCLVSYDESDADDKMTDNVFQRCDSVVLYHHPVNDNVYILSPEGEIRQRIRIDFDGNNPPAELQYSYEKLIENGGKKKYTFLYDCPLIANGILIGSVFSQGDKECVLYDTQTEVAGKSAWREGLKLTDIVLPLCVTNNAIIGWMDYSIYSVLADKGLVPTDVVSVLEKGGHTLVLYHRRDRK